MAEHDQTLPRLVQALDEVSQWRESQEQSARARLDEIASEQERLEADIAELQRQVAELDGLRESVQSTQQDLPAQELSRTRAAVEAGVLEEAESLAVLDEAYGRALKAREEHVATLLAQPEMAQLVEEYEQFQAVEPTLANLPQGYRDAILAHNESVQRRLQPVFAAAAAPLAPADVQPSAVTVVASLNPAEGVPEALALILPVTYQVYEDWSERGEDLRAILAFRVVAALGAALDTVGAADAAVQYADYRGLLAIQVWFGDQAPSGDLREALSTELDRLGQEAVELTAVRLELFSAWLDPQVVSGADEDEEEPDDPTAPDLSDTLDDGASAGAEA